MAVWEITAPDGTVYEVEGEDEEGAMKALNDKIVADVRQEYQNLPWYKQAYGATNDIMRIMANAPGGYADEFSAYMGGTDPEKEKWETEKARIRAGSATIPAEILPALAMPALRAGTIPRNLAIGAAEGGTYGGLLARAHDEDVTEGAITGALTGGGVSAGGQILRQGAKAAPSVLKRGGVGLAKEAGKLNVKEGILAALGGLGANAMGHPISTTAAIGTGLAIPMVGALGRAIANPRTKKAISDAFKAAKEQRAANSPKFFSPTTRQGLTATGILSEEELRKKKRGY